VYQLILSLLQYSHEIDVNGWEKKWWGRRNEMTAHTQHNTENINTKQHKRSTRQRTKEKQSDYR
jgi:hypothetical protein